ncbi:hypothetical protein ACQV2Q_05150 [Facklamia sp. P12950]
MKKLSKIINELLFVGVYILVSVLISFFQGKLTISYFFDNLLYRIIGFVFVYSLFYFVDKKHRKENNYEKK